MNIIKPIFRTWLRSQIATIIQREEQREIAYETAYKLPLHRWRLYVKCLRNREGYVRVADKDFKWITLDNQ